MTTFAKQSFSASNCASFRPTYPRSLYDTVLAGQRDVCVELGCGHGLISRALAPHFAQVIGTDPSPGIVSQSQLSSPPTSYSKVTFRQASAEWLLFLEDGSVDLIVAGQSAHWFDQSRLWPEMARVLRKGGTLAFWGYKDNVFVKWPYATKLLHKMTSPFTNDLETLGPYWEPGRKIVVRKLRDVVPPSDMFEDETRIEYEPNMDGKGKGSGEGTLFVQARMTVEGFKEYLRTFSSVHSWQEKHPDNVKRSAGGNGDFVDLLFDRASEKEDIWKHEEEEVDVEWGSALLMARKK
ncbi:S-adenosyl-L-methionine-dependent methyltransferase [Rhizodiscina lignyota]|uniref:S-adenosyl-L-methionine-dependent methyltransferase n=1 Tax=Rhizodiscina lignyota TaxID=1504668 RepID=A0A9P4I0L6_9PEZI|nr:S-adenosyl-L-methionine-dependent methyltransferase [Rhizodiscina lignyota]